MPKHPSGHPNPGSRPIEPDGLRLGWTRQFQKFQRTDYQVESSLMSYGEINGNYSKCLRNLSFAFEQKHFFEVLKFLKKVYLEVEVINVEKERIARNAFTFLFKSKIPESIKTSYIADLHKAIGSNEYFNLLGKMKDSIIRTFNDALRILNIQ